MIRVLHVHGSNLYGGVEALLATIARQRKLCPGMQSEFALCFEGRFAAELRQAGIEPFLLGKVRTRDPLSIRRARKLLSETVRNRHPDAVICHMPWAQSLFGPVIKTAGVPLLFWMHGASMGRHWLDRWASLTQPDYVICNSEYTASTVRNLYSRVTHAVCYPPVALEELPLDAPGRIALRREHQTPADAVVVVQASRIERWKGHALHLEALGVLRDTTRSVCWIAGGPQRTEEERWLRELRHKASRLGISDRIRFLGQRSDVRLLLRAADIYCQPNCAPEPFGIAFIEAMAARLPIVTTAIGATHEVVDGSCGIMVSPGDSRLLAESLHRLIDDEAERKRLGANGPARAARLCDPRRQLERLHSIVATAIRTRTEGTPSAASS